MTGWPYTEKPLDCMVLAEHKIVGSPRPWHELGGMRITVPG